MRALTQRPRLLLVPVLAVALAGGLAGGFLSRRGSDGPQAPARTTTLEVQQMTAGPVTVAVTPLRLDAESAAFRLVLDNHDIDLTMDLAAGASLSVGLTRASAARWSGDGPSGHHREGTLSFADVGAGDGAVVLELSGLPEPVRFTWER